MELWNVVRQMKHAIAITVARSTASRLLTLKHVYAAAAGLRGRCVAAELVCRSGGGVGLRATGVRHDAIPRAPRGGHMVHALAAVPARI